MPFHIFRRKAKAEPVRYVVVPGSVPNFYTVEKEAIGVHVMCFCCNEGSQENARLIADALNKQGR